MFPFLKTANLFSLSLLVLFLACAIPALAHGTTYYVAKTGSNNNTCTQAKSVSAPKLTITEGLTCLSAGDTLLIKPGTYLETITGGMIPSGTSTSNRTKVIGDAGAKWTIKPPSQSACTANSNAVIRITSRNYIEIADFIIDGRYGGSFACPNGIVLNDSDDNYIHHVEIHHTSDDPGFGSAILLATSTTDRNHVSHLYAHDIGGAVGKDTAHCTYYSGNDNIIEYTTVHTCPGHGIHYYDQSDTATNNRNIIRWNYVYNTGSHGIGLYRGSDNQIYGNIIANAGATGANGGFRVQFTHNVKVYNNTVYNVTGYCIRANSTTSATIKNNACVDNGKNSIDDTGSGTTTSSNRFTTDETVFVDAATNRFSPRLGSVLIDAGTSIGLPIGIGFLGAAPDQGAVEFATLVTSAPPPQAPNAPAYLQIGP